MGGEALLLVRRVPSTPQMICMARKICEAGLRTLAVLSFVVCDFFSFFLFTGKAHFLKKIFLLKYSCFTMLC